MKKTLNLTVISVMLVLLVGCGDQFGSGGGMRTIVTGTTAKQAVYGIDGGKKLGFVIFTDQPAEGRSSSAGSSWTGELGGPGVPYEGDSDELAIDGTRYKFANGRVFLVSSNDDGISVRQLNVPIGDATYKAEIERIAKLEDLREFLSK
jgi:hypothetical protein